MPALYFGGAEKQYRYIIDELQNKNRRLVVLILNSPLKNEESITKEFIKQHSYVEFYCLNGKVMNINNGNKIAMYIAKIFVLLKQTVWLFKFLKKNQINTVMFSYVTQLLMIPIFNKYNVKAIFNERNTGRQICDKKFKINLLKKCYKVISNSAYASQYINDKTGLDIEVFNNGIKFNDLELVKHEQFNIVVPARITPIKNQEVVIKALGTLKDIDGIALNLIGVIEDKYYAKKLDSIIFELQLQKNVNFMGYVNDISKIYSPADLIILTSYEEGTPNVLLEAYLYKIFSLASNIPMNVQCCTDEDILFEPDNYLQLASRIKSFLLGDLKRKKEKIVEKNYRFVKKNYSMSNLKEKYEQLLY